MAITHNDLIRLSAHVEEPPSALVDWLAPDAVDMTDEPGSFVQLRQGRRLMVLAHSDGACRFLDKNGTCSVYVGRPRDCELFPFSLERTAKERGATMLSLLELEGCDYARDGAHDAETLSEADARRWKELEEYQTRVARWNRLAKHRARLHRPVGTAHEFLAFLMS